MDGGTAPSAAAHSSSTPGGGAGRRRGWGEAGLGARGRRAVAAGFALSLIHISELPIDPETS
ncbi:hypothetical protein ACFWBN_30695, partial [Streptomyces sp. NPDC059989]|uniref:hypothetical protein n=1 Tax=Streptomyces sp. NPDC059989 TaxID=3347026 RepID=UPI0036D13172